MQIVLISAYHGGSHEAWASGLRRHSKHTIQLLTLPARFWKWRMHGGAITLARRYLRACNSAPRHQSELFLFTDMVDMSTFLAMVRRACPDTPAALYMHENQLTYPLPATPDSGPMRRQKGERDLHYAFINFASMVVADRVIFNSNYHRRDVFAELPRYLRHFPEYNELGLLPELVAKSSVLPVGIDLASLSAEPCARRSGPPLIIWNQRWEYDKNPDQFFRILIELAQEGLDFRLAVCGESFARQPDAFDVARERLRDQLVHWGYADRNLYVSLLWQADITISTAIHEFFGISILEAMACATHVILPNRLSYPEIVPPELHANCLYEDEPQLKAMLRGALQDPEETRVTARRLAEAAARFDWKIVAPLYDEELERLL